MVENGLWKVENLATLPRSNEDWAWIFGKLGSTPDDLNSKGPGFGVIRIRERLLYQFGTWDWKKTKVAWISRIVMPAIVH